MARRSRGSPPKGPRNGAERGVQATFQKALALHQQGHIAKAQGLYRSIIELQPKHFDSMHLLGVTFIQSGQLQAGVDQISSALHIDPQSAPAHNNQGFALLALRQIDAALASFERALAIAPNYADAHFNRGLALLELQRNAEALAAFDQALAINPNLVDPQFYRANALLKLGCPAEALTVFDRLLAAAPDHADAHSNRGYALLELQRPSDALTSLDRALSLVPNHADALSNRGSALIDLKRPAEALMSLDQALAINPEHADAHNNRGSALMKLNRLDEAMASFERALAINPHHADAHNSRGNALLELKRFDEAMQCFDRALELRPDHAVAHNNRGNTLLKLKKPIEAIAQLDQALALRPHYAIAHQNRGIALSEIKQLDEAIACFERAQAIDPELDYLFGTHMHTKMMVCNWDHWHDNIARYSADIAAGKAVTTPFSALSLLDNPQLHLQLTTSFARSKYRYGHRAEGFEARQPNNKIRIGYYSADFRNHATAWLMAELFESHDKNKFEVYGFAFGPPTNDDILQRLAASFDRFIDVNSYSDKEIARLSRELGIDIAMDIKGYTQDARVGMFAERCAPIQVNYLGYPGTMGVDYIDYIIADKVVIPDASRQYYAEKVVYLPHSYQANDSTRQISPRMFTRQECGLPDHGFVYCCFNNNYKILPETFDGWMRILKAVDGSVLWLLEDNATAAANLRREAVSRGADGDRLVFARRIKLDEHLARQRLANLCLDTLPYNAHTTASDALWAGVPLLTRAGLSFASRVAASLLSAVGLPELVTQTQADYEALAIALGRDQARLAQIKSSLDTLRLTSPLFNGKLFAKHLEKAFEAMQARYLAGLPPDTIEVAAE